MSRPIADLMETALASCKHFGGHNKSNMEKVFEHKRNHGADSQAVSDAHSSLKEFLENQSVKQTISILDRSEAEWKAHRVEEDSPRSAGYLERKEFLNKIEATKQAKKTIII
eukprot:GEMP01109434.1.p1 GENE.GEMP01109434.1~~GEMP01109434.1.p1  ORF type:complete len:112 (+),score=13.70 GEMP01109434.1:269-604(+)